MEVKLFYVAFNLNCRLHAVSVGKPSEHLSLFEQFCFLKLNANRFWVFRTDLNMCYRLQFLLFVYCEL